MGATYICQTEARRAKVRASALNGIDYLEVLDRDAPAGSPRQQTILVRCWKALPRTMGAAEVTISGGVRVAGIAVAWARRLDVLVQQVGEPSDPLAPGEDAGAWRDRAAALDAQTPRESHRWLVVRTSAAGDSSPYSLSLTLPGGASEAAVFDPKSASVTFGFKVDCPSDFDCPTEPPCPVQLPASPPIDYLARDYASFRRLMLDRLAALVPGYAPLGPADLGVTLVEILAHAADHLAYYQDAVATEAYLGTARRRVSVRRHARLLDYPVHEGVNARAWIALELADGQEVIGTAAAPALPAGTRVLTRTTGSGAVLSSSAFEQASKQDPIVFETLAPVETLSFRRNTIQFHTWSDAKCCLPKGATAATLVGSAAELDLHAGDVLIFEEVFGPRSGLAADADPAHRHAVRLTSEPVETTDAVEGVTVLEIAWGSDDALPFPLSLWEIGASRASVARGNVALADHGLSVAGEALPAPPAEGRYRPSLVEKGITWRVPFDGEGTRATPAAEALIQDARSATPALVVTAGNDVWTPRADLLSSDAYATELVVETDDDGTAHLRFGDGVHGRRPTAGVAMTASYRVGRGAAGNVGAEALVTVVADSLAGIVTSVRNPLAAAGGVDPETIDEVKRYAPQAFRRQERAVTREDWAEIAARHPEVQKAVATFRWTGSYTTVFVAVDRKGGLPADDAFRAEIEAFLEPYRLAGYDVVVTAPKQVPLDIAMSVCVERGYFASDVERALADAFSNRTLSDGRLGFFHPDAWSFGDPVYLSRVIAAAMAIPGVHWVDLDDTPPKTNRFQRWGQAADGEIAAGRISMGSLEIARLDNDPNAPEDGRISFTITEGA